VLWGIIVTRKMGWLFCVTAMRIEAHRADRLLVSSLTMMLEETTDIREYER
jgi:hypothetical protein